MVNDKCSTFLLWISSSLTSNAVVESNKHAVELLLP